MLSSNITGENRVIVHPLVLLNVVDHYNRIAKGTNKRVLGALLGEVHGNVLHVTNSFALPFEEDNKDSHVWFVDHNYHERMYILHRKVNVKEKMLGWYSTGSTLKKNDIDINELFRRFVPNPIYVTIDVSNNNNDMNQFPVRTYVSIEKPANDREYIRTFNNVICLVDAFESEQVGVEHLLRDVRNMTTSTLSNKVGNKLISLKCLVQKLNTIVQYLQQIISQSGESEQVTIDRGILYNLNELFYSLPNLQYEVDLKNALQIQQYDQHIVLYVNNVVQTILALHHLIDNLLNYQSNASTAANKGPTNALTASTTNESTDGSGDKKEKKDEKEEKKEGKKE